MFSYMLCMFVIIASVNGCDKKAMKRYGESCQCSDICLDSSQCQRNGTTGFACLCLPCLYYDPVLKQCIDIPGLDEPCNTVCEAPYVCTNGTDGNRTCQPCPDTHYFDESLMKCIKLPVIGESCTTVCARPYGCINGTDGNRTCQPCPDTQYFDEDLKKCIILPTIGEACKSACACNLKCQANPSTGGSSCVCSPESTGWDPLQQICKYDCFTNYTNSCKCFPNGDYKACFPMCQDGVYITCYNGSFYVRDCGLAWYVRPDASRFTAKMVFDQTTDSCQRSSPYCPRPLDAQVEGR